MTPEEYEILATRVLTEEPNAALREAVHLACGWRVNFRGTAPEVWVDPHDTSLRTYDRCPAKISLARAASFMVPEALWTVWRTPHGFITAGASLLRCPAEFATVSGPDEPRARTALALRLRAVMVRAGETP